MFHSLIYLPNGAYVTDLRNRMVEIKDILFDFYVIRESII